MIIRISNDHIFNKFKKYIIPADCFNVEENMEDEELEIIVSLDRYCFNCKFFNFEDYEEDAIIECLNPELSKDPCWESESYPLSKDPLFGSVCSEHIKIIPPHIYYDKSLIWIKSTIYSTDFELIPGKTVKLLKSVRGLGIEGEVFTIKECGVIDEQNPHIYTINFRTTKGKEIIKTEFDIRLLEEIKGMYD